MASTKMEVAGWGGWRGRGGAISPLDRQTDKRHIDSRLQVGVDIVALLRVHQLQLHFPPLPSEMHFLPNTSCRFDLVAEEVILVDFVIGLCLIFHPVKLEQFKQLNCLQTHTHTVQSPSFCCADRQNCARGYWF